MTATIVQLQFLSQCLPSSPPSINSGSHTLHRKDSGLVAKSAVIKNYVFTFRAALYNVGLGKKTRYFVRSALKFRQPFFENSKNSAHITPVNKDYLYGGMQSPESTKTANSPFTIMIIIIPFCIQGWWRLVLRAKAHLVWRGQRERRWKN